MSKQAEWVGLTSCNPCACMLQQDIKTSTLVFNTPKSLKQKNVKVSTHNEIQSSQQTPQHFTKSIKRQKISEVKLN